MNREPIFQLLLFSTGPDYIRQAVGTGVGGIIVDWEYIDKEGRQALADTQINRDTPEDLRRVRRCTNAPVICRINAYGKTTSEEIEQAIEAGADELFLPMVRTLEEVEAVLGQARGRCGVGILTETKESVELIEELARLPLSRVYVGLNDLAIERQTPNIFTPLVDGMLEHIRGAFRIPFGFGGLTLPERGSPIPCRLLIAEMARLKCSFSFLRRSFHRDMRGRDLAVEVPRILGALKQASYRSKEEIEQDRQDLTNTILSWNNRKAGMSGVRHGRF